MAFADTAEQSAEDASDLLARINADLPDLDWKAGARRYVADYFARFPREQIAHFIRTKPLGRSRRRRPWRR